MDNKVYEFTKIPDSVLYPYVCLITIRINTELDRNFLSSSMRINQVLTINIE